MDLSTIPPPDRHTNRPFWGCKSGAHQIDRLAAIGSDPSALAPCQKKHPQGTHQPRRQYILRTTPSRWTTITAHPRRIPLLKRLLAPPSARRPFPRLTLLLTPISPRSPSLVLHPSQPLRRRLLKSLSIRLLRHQLSQTPKQASQNPRETGRGKTPTTVNRRRHTPKATAHLSHLPTRWLQLEVPRASSPRSNRRVDHLSIHWEVRVQCGRSWKSCISLTFSARIDIGGDEHIVLDLR